MKLAIWTLGFAFCLAVAGAANAGGMKYELNVFIGENGTAEDELDATGKVHVTYHKGREETSFRVKCRDLRPRTEYKVVRLAIDYMTFTTDKKGKCKARVNIPGNQTVGGRVSIRQVDDNHRALWTGPGFLGDPVDDDDDDDDDDEHDDKDDDKDDDEHDDDD